MLFWQSYKKIVTLHKIVLRFGMKKTIYSPRLNNSTPSMVVVGNALPLLDELLADKRVIVITDSNLMDNYASLISRYRHIIIGQGEQCKNLATVEYIHRRLLEMGADRGSYIVGFGGGIVTDIAGFAASTFMRGIGFGFVASSLLAQVDASVGGKNGVNLDGYKNIIGTFNQPDFVLCDLSLLKTLPKREMRAGMCEALKSAIIDGGEMFDIFENYDFEQICSTPELLFRVVSGSVELKARIVAEDERESGVRKLLNLGHTFAHAIEKCSRKYVHGEAVAIGIAIISLFSKNIGELPDNDYKSIMKSIENIGLPHRCDDITMEALAEAAKSDKKRTDETIDLVLVRGVGECFIRKFDIDEICKVLQ